MSAKSEYMPLAPRCIDFRLAAGLYFSAISEGLGAISGRVPCDLRLALIFVVVYFAGWQFSALPISSEAARWTFRAALSLKAQSLEESVYPLSDLI